MFQSPSLVNTM